jgi:signal transduction histidine kinase
MTSLLRNMADDVAVRILLHAPGVHVRLGAKDLEAILLNVVKNAKEAIVDCEGTVTIHTSRLEPDLAEDRTLLATMGLPVNGSYVRIQISDSGLGFPIEHQPHLFEPFFTTKAGATGMGLTLTYGMVRQAGGAITLERVVSGGTRVSIVLPQTITSDERD